MPLEPPDLALIPWVSRARRTTRSAFIREALKAEIRRQRVREEETRHAEGYARQPVLPGEFDVWLNEQDSVAEADVAKLRQRIRDNTPSPGTEAALRHQIETLERGEPDYSAMGPGLAEATRQQLPQIKDLFKRIGVLKSLVFSKVLPNGADLYIATFEHGQLECMILPLSPTGRVTGDFFHQSH